MTLLSECKLVAATPMKTSVSACGNLSLRLTQMREAGLILFLSFCLSKRADKKVYMIDVVLDDSSQLRKHAAACPQNAGCSSVVLCYAQEPASQSKLGGEEGLGAPLAQCKN